MRPIEARDVVVTERSASSTLSCNSSTKEQPDPINKLDSEPKSPLLWSRIRSRHRNAFSEFFGTFIFLLFSFGVTAQVVLSESKKGDYTTLCLGWG
jgi:hypothetical protein